MLKLENARKALVAAEAEAVKQGTPICCVVVDAAGNLVAATRMDGALVVSPKFAFAKAYTAATIGLPTGGIAEYAVPGKPYYTFTDLDSNFTVVAGGLPVKEGNKVVGGVGVGGSHDTSQDVVCAQAAVKILES